LIAGPFPSEPEPDESSYKSKYDDIDWIVDTRNPATALQSSLNFYEKCDLDDQLSRFELSLLMPRMPGLALL